MKILTLSLLVSLMLSLAAPSVLSAESSLTPFFARHGVVDPRIAAYVPPFEKKPVPRHWRRGYYLFPYNGSYRDTWPEQKRTSPPPKIIEKESHVLNPAIFNPEPTIPLTLVIEDGVIVDRYLGY